jgi:hypothetical protein
MKIRAAIIDILHLIPGIHSHDQDFGISVKGTFERLEGQKSISANLFGFTIITEVCS